AVVVDRVALFQRVRRSVQIGIVAVVVREHVPLGGAAPLVLVVGRAVAVAVLVGVERLGIGALSVSPAIAGARERYQEGRSGARPLSADAGRCRSALRSHFVMVLDAFEPKGELPRERAELAAAVARGVSTVDLLRALKEKNAVALADVVVGPQAVGGAAMVRA